MKKEEVQNWFFDLYDNIIPIISDKSDLIDLHNIYKNPEYEISNKEKDKLKDISIIDFYKVNEWWEVSWKTKDSLDFFVEGVFNFYPLKKVLYNWDEEFGGESWAPDMKGFRPLDMFYESAGCVGFFINRKDKKGLYLYKFDGETQSLDIDFEGYLKLLGMTKGYGWWQNSLIEVLTGNPQPNVKAFKEEMPKIFSDFNWEEFVKLYQSLRLSKNK